jgi:hypothetical protein
VAELSDRSEAGRQLAALSSANHPREIICPVCGQPFVARNVRARFCSNACRQKNKYRLAREKRAGTESVR